MKSSKDALKEKLSILLPILNEKQRRILVATEANGLGHGGIEVLANITGISRPAIRRGLEEVRTGDYEPERIRRVGAGRKRLTEKNPGLVHAIETLIDPSTRGDPESPLRWTSKSVRKIAKALEDQNYSVSHQTVANILSDQEYSLQGNKKTKEGKSHPDRDQQFQYIYKLTKTFLSKKDPVISVDAKKKELVGNYKNIGKEWERKGQPNEVNGHDFPDPKVPRAIPYGIYDIGDNKGWVNVGITSDTAEFAVETIRQWWRRMGKNRYPKSRKILICADSGGSNSYRSRLWKKELQELADQEKIDFSVCHFPPGTSKWNKIEHRLFSVISQNWRGKPLLSYQIIVNLIASAKTEAGLTVKVILDKRKYKKGIKIPDVVMEKLKIKRHDFHGEWNYTIRHRKLKRTLIYLQALRKVAA